MKRLYLIRHAKSSWEHPEQDDLERPLNQRGLEDIDEMAQWLKGQNVQPDLMITSPAKRALETTTLFAKKLKYPTTQIVVNDKIYEANVEDLIEVIQDFNDSDHQVMLFGHVPSLNWLANFLCNDHLINIPTCGIYCIDFNTKHWKDFTETPNELVFFKYPKHHDEKPQGHDTIQQSN